MPTRFIETTDPDGNKSSSTQTEGNDNIWEDKQHLDIIKHYIEEPNIPQKIKEREWSITSRSMINNFFEEKDLPLLDCFLQIFKIEEMISKPAHLLTQAGVNEISKIEHYGYLAAKRSIGFKGDRVNERSLQNTQIHQSIGNSNTMQKRKKILGLI
jgi:hypothetical protein